MYTYSYGRSGWRCSSYGVLHDNDKLQEGEVAIWPTIDDNKPKDTDDERGLHILEMCQFAKYDWLAEANHGMRRTLKIKLYCFHSLIHQYRYI